MDAPAPGYGVGGSRQGADEEDDAAAEERFDPASFLVDHEQDGILDLGDQHLMDPAVRLVDYDGEEEEEHGDDEMLANPNQQHQMVVHGLYDMARVSNLILTNEWNLLEEHLVDAMPRSTSNTHPSLVHPTPFITIWRRQVMDLIGGGRYDEAARIFVEKVVPLKAVVTAYADADKLSEEIAKIERSVGSRTSFAHAHCGTELMMKLINDYMRFYLPDVIGVTEFKECSIGVGMTEHLQVCPGMTPEAKRRYGDALKKGEVKKKRYRANVVDANVSKAPKLTEDPPTDPLHMIYQKLQDAKQVLDTMRSNQQVDVNLGIDSLDGILDNIGGLVALAMQGQAAAPPPQAQAPIPAQAVIAAAVPVPVPVPRQAPAPAAANPPAPAPAPPTHQHVPAPPPALQVAPQDVPAPPPAVQLQGPPQDAPVPPAALQAAVVPPLPPAPAPEDGVPDYYSAFDNSEFLPELPEL